MSSSARIAALFLLGATVCSPAGAAEKPIDVAQSTIRIHVGKAGLFSVAGHEHWVRAPIASGSLQESEPAQVSFTVEAGRLMVEPDKTLSDKDQAEVQRTMQQKVLESKRYPEISFHSTDVERVADNKWRVKGELLLHGQSRPVSALVVKKQDEYVGSCRIKQSDFGIRRVSVGGGVVKVKDELEIDFAITPAATSAAKVSQAHAMAQ